MNITRENIDALNGIIKVVIAQEDYQANVDQVLNDYRKKATMPGFRPGKVPAGLVKKMYGKAALVDEVNKALSQSLSKYLVEEKLNILGEPLPNDEQTNEIDWEKETEFEFVFDIGYAPEIEVKFDKRSKFPMYKVKISDDMISQEVDAYTNRFGENVPDEVVDETSSIRGDISQIDGEASAQMALISVSMIKDEEIKKTFIGKKIDDEVVFDLKKAYPNDTEIAYLLNIEKEVAAELEGDFKIAIKEINKFQQAEVNEDLFKKIYGEETEIKDEKAFHAKIVEEIELAYKTSIDYRFSLDAREAITNKIEMEFPEAFLKRWVLATNKELTEEQLESEFEQFLNDLKWQIIKDTIIKENELKVEPEELEALAREVATAQFRQYGMMTIPEEHLAGFTQQMLEKEEDRNRLFQKCMEDKVMDVIKEKVAINEKEVSKEEFDKMFEKK